ncbi:MAG: penicillin-binding protein 2 [Candidatus Zixiibacteriota bacterium]|nr:MAG: penicillin-binding protein 2 [candidate division Zixibacteria bacterium]
MIADSPERRKTNYRILILAILAFMLFIVVKLFGMQLFSGGVYKKASERNSVRIVPISAPRGLIKDRDGTTLVKNRPSYSMYMVPYEVKNLDSMSIKIAEVLKENPEEIRNRISQGWKGRFQPIRLKRDVDFGTVCHFEEHALDFPGIMFQVEPTRLYPQSNLGSHIWGYVGEATAEELEEDAENRYALGDIVGKEGLEKQYEEYLRGVNGLKYIEITAAGKMLGELTDKERIKPVRGSELVLELDWELQNIAEKELLERGSGAVVALDPRDGAVRIMASVPNFDANLFSGVVSREAWDAVMSDSLHPLYNRSIKGTYPPGSTMKLFTAAAGLENDIVVENSTFDPCLGARRFGNRPFRCWRPGGHGKLDLVGAIIQSCDIYFYQLGVQEGLDIWSKFCKDSRFGMRTGIDLPGEVTGLVPSARYFDKRYGKSGWTRYLVVNLSIGQGELLVTPLQMAVLFAALGNGGIIYSPRLASRIITYGGDIIKIEPEIVGSLPVSEENLEILKKGLLGVTTHERGTARVAALKDIDVGGKTGTAQNPHGEDHALFICFAPLENPEIAIAVIVENAGHGGSVAAPLAKKILLKYFEEYRADINPVKKIDI